MKVGDTITLHKQPVSTRQIVMYAGASGDFNPIHYDHSVAEKVGLGSVIAHGMLSMGFAAQLIGDSLTPHGWIKEISARFLSPVRPGDVVELTGCVTEVSNNANSTNNVHIKITAEVNGKRVLSGYAVIIEDLKRKLR